MRDNFHAVVKRAVGFNVNMFIVFVCDFKKFFGIVVIFSSSVDFQFNAEISWTLTVKYRFGLVVVLVDRTVFTDLMIAFGAIVAVLKAKSVVSVNKRITFFAACIVIVVTVRTKICIIIAVSVRFPYSRSAPVANDGISVNTGRANGLSVNCIKVLVLN